jgi:hypothetical protein
MASRSINYGRSLRRQRRVTSPRLGAWRHANVDDLPKAAKDWPQLNFVIYHSAMRPFIEDPSDELAEFERTGPHSLGHRPCENSREIRRQQRLRRYRYLLCRHGNYESAVMRSPDGDPWSRV